MSIVPPNRSQSHTNASKTEQSTFNLKHHANSCPPKTKSHHRRTVTITTPRVTRLPQLNQSWQVPSRIRKWPQPRKQANLPRQKTWRPLGSLLQGGYSGRLLPVSRYYRLFRDSIRPQVWQLWHAVSHVPGRKITAKKLGTFKESDWTQHNTIGGYGP